MTDDGRALSLLIVEDEAMIRALLRQTVLDAGHTVLATCASLGEALARVELDAARIDAVLLDANLRGQTAAPLADRLRALGLPFILITGYSTDHVDDIAQGAPILQKPFPLKALTRALSQIAGD